MLKWETEEYRIYAHSSVRARAIARASTSTRVRVLVLVLVLIFVMKEMLPLQMSKAK